MFATFWDFLLATFHKFPENLEAVVWLRRPKKCRLCTAITSNKYNQMHR
ncbi:hypothetical protein X975_14299, partial [Stegodyphus mimosarum]